jgi:ferredoxin
MFKFKMKKPKVITLQIFESKCIGCERCVEQCRRKVLGMAYKDDRSYATVEYPDRCTGCGNCSWKCPTDAIELITAKNDEDGKTRYK